MLAEPGSSAVCMDATRRAKTCLDDSRVYPEGPGLGKHPGNSSIVKFAPPSVDFHNP